MKENSINREQWVDTARAIGMILVYYGHVMQMFWQKSYTVGIAQYKFIYSFHMPLFFFLAGFFYKSTETSFFQYFKHKSLQRLIPIVAYSVFLLPFWCYYLRNDLARFVGLAIKYLKGHPSFNMITWFLVCMFTAEVIAYFLKGAYKRWPFMLILLSLTVGLYITYINPTIELNLGTNINYWFFQESIIVIGFYFMGNQLFKWLKKAHLQMNTLSKVLILVSAAGILIFSYNYNEVVMMANGVHGNSFWFLLNAFLGITMIISVSMLIGANSILDYIGKNSIVFFGVNGLFCYFIYPNVNNYLKITINDNWVVVTAYVTIVTILSLILSVPLIYVISNYFPQLNGKYWVKGPVLPSLGRRLEN